MKRVLIIAILTLLAISSGFADGYPAEEAEHWEKVRQLEQLADRFKAETGFTGTISHDLNRMCLGTYRGRFAGIQVTAESDTATFRAAFEQILDKVLPYTFAKREQLIRSRITRNLGRIETEFYQQVNGYRVEGIGRLIIAYDSGRYGFVIGNGTVVLPEITQINYNSEEATNIAIQYHRAKCSQPEQQNKPPYLIEDLRFFDSDTSGYSLKYIIYIGDFVYYVDASTGRLDWNYAIGDDLSSFTIKGKVYNPFCNDPPVVLGDSLYLTQIEVKVNGETKYTNDAGEASFQDSTVNSFIVKMKCREYYLTDFTD